MPISENTVTAQWFIDKSVTDNRGRMIRGNSLIIKRITILNSAHVGDYLKTRPPAKFTRTDHHQ